MFILITSPEFHNCPYLLLEPSVFILFRKTRKTHVQNVEHDNRRNSRRTALHYDKQITNTSSGEKTRKLLAEIGKLNDWFSPIASLHLQNVRLFEWFSAFKIPFRNLNQSKSPKQNPTLTVCYETICLSVARHGHWTRKPNNQQSPSVPLQYFFSFNWFLTHH